jgi:hypothetical protein
MVVPHRLCHGAKAWTGAGGAPDETPHLNFTIRVARRLICLQKGLRRLRQSVPCGPSLQRTATAPTTQNSGLRRRLQHSCQRRCRCVRHESKACRRVPLVRVSCFCALRVRAAPLRLLAPSRPPINRCGSEASDGLRAKQGWVRRFESGGKSRWTKPLLRRKFSS